MPVASRAVRGAATVAGLCVGLAGAGLIGAAPALAVDDPDRPGARVTHGPSCRPGGVVVEITGGVVAYEVTLATSRASAGEDAAVVQPGEVVVLRTGDVDWGETIDPDLRYTSIDGTDAYADELQGYSFTRPAAEDCAAITPPTGAAQVPPIGTPPVLAAPVDEVEPVPGRAGAGVESPVVPAAAATDLPVPDGGTSWPLLVTGSALLATSIGLARAAGRRRAQPPGPVPPGSA
ncbi:MULTISPECIES: hypothetical protein [unclassified Geodermatophilus]|uniref:hypothetical protein n=1 Tax=unclassified Geodermatophilus TaxID=2637632 RepID=UPI003EEBE720